MHDSRHTLAKNVRIEAAELAARRPPVKHCNNKEEYEYRDTASANTPATHLANFTKGLPHDLETGLLSNAVDYKLFINGIQSGDPVDFEKTPLGPASTDSNAARIPDTPSVEAITSAVFDRRPFWQSKFAKQFRDPSKFAEQERGARVRAWESAGAGNVLDLEGPDAQAVTMPPAPRLDSDELFAEIVEVYAMALLRDCPFSDFPLPEGTSVNSNRGNPDRTRNPHSKKADEIDDAFSMLSGLPWFCGYADEWGYEGAELARRRDLTSVDQIFRGVTPGEEVGPYLSQFMLLGNRALGATKENGRPDANNRTPQDGFVGYGAIGIQQKVRIATCGKDYMTVWEQFVDVQNGADLRGAETYEPANGPDKGHRFIATPRDLATYVHYDALYEAYLNACLSLLGSGAPFDRGIPFLEADTFDKQQGFAHFGGPHILTLVCEAATRALKAVRYQKFNVHRRLRPEAVGGLMDRWLQGNASLNSGPLRPVATLMTGDGSSERKGIESLKWGRKEFLNVVKAHNYAVNKEYYANETNAAKSSYLLPMAFPEGSPMHPSYGAGHGTVAGACVTILKAYFDHGWTAPEWFNNGQPVAYQPSRDGSRLVALDLDAPLTVEGELNKLAANIAIGRNWAGVHYYSDYIESMRLGEEIAIGILEEQKLTYPENFTMTVPLFDGGAIRI